jgi:hypothetical protein
MKVISTPEVKEYFNELVTILYEKGYFLEQKFIQNNM